MEFFKKIFCRRKQFKPQPKQLRIDGVKTTLTPKPDDAELAAQALLETLNNSQYPITNKRGKAAKKQKTSGFRPQTSGFRPQTSDFRPQTSDQPHDAAYYQQLSEKIRTAHDQERRMAMRYVSYVEEQLALMDNGQLKMENEATAEKKLSTIHSQLSIIERGLYQHQNAVEREGGELLRRWQHCLAECIVRQMSAADAAEIKQIKTN